MGVYLLELQRLLFIWNVLVVIIRGIQYFCFCVLIEFDVIEEKKDEMKIDQRLEVVFLGLEGWLYSEILIIRFYGFNFFELKEFFDLYYIMGFRVSVYFFW